MTTRRRKSANDGKGRGAPQAPSAARVRAAGPTDYARLLAGMTHDFRTPLGSIVGAASTLDDYADAIDPETRSRLCSAIIDGAQHLDQLLSGLTAIARVRTDFYADETSPVELNEILQGMSAQAGQRHARPVRISVNSSDLIVNGHPAALQSLILAMLDLANGFMPDDDAVDISLSENDGFAVLRMTSGVHDDAAARLGQTLDGVPAGVRVPAHAVYVAAISEVVHISGGKVSISHDPGDSGLSQTVRLPLCSV